LDFARLAELDGRRLVLVANGAGPARATEAFDVAARNGKLDRVVSVGYCGALDPSLEAGDVFVASRVDDTERGVSYATELPGSCRATTSGVLVSVDRVVRTAAEKRALRALGASAVEMESAGLAAKAAGASLPFYCIRAVLDTAEDEFDTDFNAARDRNGRLRTARIIRAALARPFRRVPELYRLHRRSRLVARSLGDFLADCRF
jgi:adenosylhomocysteine nucleosidase